MFEIHKSPQINENYYTKNSQSYLSPKISFQNKRKIVERYKYSPRKTISRKDYDY